ncbi:hypothetical protein TRICI_001430 [Trichomonascus ciferrii]|uniref:Kinetochore-associated protein n=1 Tax=Trichomonascus ciferrii TaxID=44093 RepID=A0A642VCF7_9ASCO|nr:hypothetical protein TRICI_001430 [Trichomonascus ciferrii]
MSEEGSIRYDRLQKISQRSLQESVKFLTLQRMESCYPGIANAPKGKQALQKAMDQISNYWTTAATKEFDAVFEERDVKTKMKQLDELIHEAEQRRERQETEGSEGPIYLDSLTPQKVVDAHLRTARQETVEALEKELADLRAENEELLKAINNDGEALSNLSTAIQELFGELGSSVQSTSSLPSRSELATFTSEVTPQQ